MTTSVDSRIRREIEAEVEVGALPPVGEVVGASRRKARRRTAAVAAMPVALLGVGGLVWRNAGSAAPIVVADADPSDSAAVESTIRFEVLPGMRLAQILDGLALTSGVEVGEFRGALDSGQVVSRYYPAPAPVLPPGFSPWEGLLAVGVYEFPERATPAEVLQVMADAQANLLDELGYADAVALTGFEPYQVVALASLVEVSLPFDPSMTARVFYNRLAAGDFLGVDEATLYGLGKFSGPLVEGDFRDDDPYNLRRRNADNKLPPTAINSPSRASLDAAIRPAEGEWRFYSFDAYGQPQFAVTYQQFLALKHGWEDAGSPSG